MLSAKWIRRFETYTSALKKNNKNEEGNIIQKNRGLKKWRKEKTIYYSIKFKFRKLSTKPLPYTISNTNSNSVAVRMFKRYWMLPNSILKRPRNSYNKWNPRQLSNLNPPWESVRTLTKTRSCQLDTSNYNWSALVANSRNNFEKMSTVRWFQRNRWAIFQHTRN